MDELYWRTLKWMVRYKHQKVYPTFFKFTFICLKLESNQR